MLCSLICRPFLLLTYLLQGRIIPGAYKFNVIITTYEVILAPQCELRNIQWRVCVIDEAHRLKNRNCKLLEELKHINMVGGWEQWAWLQQACTLYMYVHMY